MSNPADDEKLRRLIIERARVLRRPSREEIEHERQQA